MAKSSNKQLLRLYKRSDYNTFCEYFHAIDGGNVPYESCLPVRGFVIENELVGFLANTDCDFMICTWYCVNPELSARKKYLALKKYFQACKEAASLTNKQHLFVYSNYSGIIKLLESLGFKKIDNGHMVVEV